MGIFLIVPTSTHVEPQPFGIVSAQGAASRVMTAAALKTEVTLLCGSSANYLLSLHLEK